MYRTIIMLLVCHSSIFGHLDLPESVAQDKALSSTIATIVATEIAKEHQQPISPGDDAHGAKLESPQIFLEYVYQGTTKIASKK